MPSDTKSIGYNNLAMAQTRRNNPPPLKNKSSGLNLHTTRIAHGVRKENMQLFVAQKDTAGKWRVHWEIIVGMPPIPRNVCRTTASPWPPPAAQRNQQHFPPSRQHPTEIHRQTVPSQPAGSKGDRRGWKLHGSHGSPWELFPLGLIKTKPTQGKN